MQPTTRRRALLAGVLAAALAGATLAAPVAEADRPERGPTTDRPSAPAALARRIVKTKKIAPGLLYTKIVEKQVPRRTFVLSIDLRKALTLDFTLARTRLPARAALSDIARRAEALAGVNGDYGSARPVHPMAQDGDLVQTSTQLGSLFAVTRDETATIFGRPSVGVTVTDRSSGRVFTLDRWNDGAPAPGEIVGFSPLGGTLEAPPPYACSVRLLPSEAPTPSASDGVDQEFAVDVAQCSADALGREGGVVLSAPPATEEATMLLALAPGTPMRLHWTFGWADVFDAIGGAPLMLLDGALTHECNSGCGRQPRTGVGVTAKGRVLLVVVDGRQANWSLGPTIDEFAQIMRGLGAVTALNLDGGGSSTMVVNGEVVNRPSDGHERAISSAVVILPGPDPGEA